MPIPAVEFDSVARLPAPGDNVAIAIRTLESGLPVRLGSTTFGLSHAVLEGHRFAIRPIVTGEPLLSWGLPFGRAVRPIQPGDYVCNQSMLDALRVRTLPSPPPAEPNFEDQIVTHRLEEASFRPGLPVAPSDRPRTFRGFRRPGDRGVGTRNDVVILGTTSRTASAAQEIARRLQPLARLFPHIDGIVAVAHTEGGGPEEPNNAAEVLRVLSGFIVHPNVAAVIALDHGIEPLDNRRLEAYLRAQHYPLDAVRHRFFTLRGSLASSLSEAERIVRAWLPEADAWRRTEVPAAGLKVALQCGGSDAFSGISGNPLAGAIAHEVVRQGGAVNLCETDELIGAESYVLSNVRDFATARALLEKIAAFKERLSWHGVTPESNPSGGNKLRGLYNIVLKSLGAAHKKDPRTRIEGVIDYAQRMLAPGFHFMNSPGNDLEGIAGQVGAGCNLFLFATGNGSITNFPFVPTLKVTTTTRRHQLLQHEMDINAGRYLDGESMASLAAEAFDLVLATASGERTKGERAGHSQVSLWRNWRQTDTSQLAALQSRPVPDGRPLVDRTQVVAVSSDDWPPSPEAAGDLTWPAFVAAGSGVATEKVGLVLPTSLCASQIARIAAERLTEAGAGRAVGIQRFVALPHTEGCGFGGESQHQRLHRTFRNYAQHPNVAAALLLEHGCEKVPNDLLRRQFEAAGLPVTRFGWASVQLDGGIEHALGKVEHWFVEKFAREGSVPAATMSWGGLCLGLLSTGSTGPGGAENHGLSGSARATLARLVRMIVSAGGSVLVPEGDRWLGSPATGGAGAGGLIPTGWAARPSLLYGQRVEQPGFHLVTTETPDWTENLAGLGACGVHAILGVVTDRAREGHPLVPVVQWGDAAARGQIPAEDVDGFFSGDDEADAARLAAQCVDVFRGDLRTASTRQGLAFFQLTRGLLGVST